MARSPDMPGMEDASGVFTYDTAALPMWINYMRKALDGVPETYPTAPQGLIRVKPAGSTTEVYLPRDMLVRISNWKPEAVFWIADEVLGKGMIVK